VCVCVCVCERERERERERVRVCVRGGGWGVCVCVMKVMLELIHTHTGTLTCTLWSNTKIKVQLFACLQIVGINSFKETHIQSPPVAVKSPAKICRLGIVKITFLLMD